MHPPLQMPWAPRRGWRGALAAAWLAAAAAAAPAQTPPAGDNVPVQLTTEKEQRNVVLVHRTGDEIYYRLPNAPQGVMATFKPEQIKEADFTLTLDQPKVYAALRQRQWTLAAQLILGGLGAAVNYLDIPENNAADLALDAGHYLVRAAELYQKAGGETNTATAQKLYVRAHEVLGQVGRAKWYPYAECAYARGVICLIEIGKLDDAEKELAKEREPQVGDAAYGMYWLAQGRLRYARDQVAPALDAAVKSMVYENKDTESFPDAILLAGQCYEDMNEIYRARDVYYEVARLFRGTSWGEAARVRVANILAKGLTAKPEAANVAGVFFGTEEDMNARCSEFLKSLDKTTPAADEKASESKDAKPAEGEKK